MTDPERLLRGSPSDDESDLEFRLLTSIRDVSAPRHAKGVAWDGIAAQLGLAAVTVTAASSAGSALQAAASQAPSVAPAALAPAAAVGTAALAPSVAPAALPVAAGLLHTLTAKIVLGVAALGTAAAVGATWAASRHAAPVAGSSADTLTVPDVAHTGHVAGSSAGTLTVPAVPHAAPVTETSPGTLAVPPVPHGEPPTPPPAPVAAGGAPEEPAAAAPSTREGASSEPRGPRTANRAQAVDRLREESAMLTLARARLRSGDPRGAMATLAEEGERFPNGVLGQEREVLTIQALAALGDTDGARRRARTFVQAHPSSPHAPLLRHLAGDP